jgi:hypothetical protein
VTQVLEFLHSMPLHEEAVNVAVQTGMDVSQD